MEIPFNKAESIAKEYLCIDTLVVQNRDSFDFHDCGVSGILIALDQAYKAGYQKHIDDCNAGLNW